VQVASGRGLIALDGATWLGAASRAAAFHRERQRTRRSWRRRPRCRHFRPPAADLDVGAEMLHLVLDITGRTLLPSHSCHLVWRAMRAGLEDHGD
jgi:hypothetical protein